MHVIGVVATYLAIARFSLRAPGVIGSSVCAAALSAAT